MAPLNKVLFLYSILLLFLFISLSAHETPQRSNMFERRRRFLLELEDEEETLQISIKKKAKKIGNEDEDEQQPILKKKSKTNLDVDDEHPQPIIKKKAKKIGNEDEDEDEQHQPIFKKKIKTNLDVDDEHPQPIIKKKAKKIGDEDEDEQHQPIFKKKIKTSLDVDEPIIKKKNQTKLIKPSSISLPKNQTKALKFKSTLNKTKINSSDSENYSTPIIKSKLKKLNSTSNSTTKGATKKSADLTADSTTSNSAKGKLEKNNNNRKPISILEDEDDDDLVSEFKDLTSKFQESFVPDLNRISKTSKIYLNKYNKEFANGFKPYVGNKHATTIASFVSFVFIVVPLILVSLVFNRIKAYFSLQRLLIFIQVYLSIYFTILCFSAIVTGLEPLRFLYSTSKSTYVCVQVMQTLAYVLYLLLLLMYLVLVFSTETGPVSKLLGLAQTIVGYAVGLHYYITVFHTAVLRQPPKTSWKVHAVYATCFFLICLLGRMDSRKKAYMGGGEEGKKN